MYNTLSTAQPAVARHQVRAGKVFGAILTAVVVAASFALSAGSANAANPHAAASATAPALGGNVIVFDPSMPLADIQAKVNAVWTQQARNEMGEQRYALLFMPGTYGTTTNPLVIQVGYYTEVAGLGQNPSDVVITGAVDAFNPDGTGSLTVFWRSVSNLTIIPAGSSVKGTASDCAFSGTEAWAVSQAAPMRRVDIRGSATFMPYCDHNNYASGGFVADSRFSGGIVMGSQQQFYMRNDTVTAGAGLSYVWNQVFSGTVNAPADNFGNGAAFTTLATTPVSKEKPYLYVDGSGNWNVFVPSLQTNSVGVSWANGSTPGSSIPLSQFFIAKPFDSVQTINSALAQGLNLLLTPGVYNYDKSIDVKRANTVVLGLGLATLTPTKGNAVMTTADVVGIDISGLTIDAGAVNSAVLMQIGSVNGNNGVPHNDASNPVALQDVFFRVGGPHIGKAAVALQVNSNNTILDDLWIWRADHGVAGSVGWTVNTSDNGLVVNGNNVTATGLFVEHFQKYNVIWNGNGGTVIFFQNELPYDPPDQASYSHGGVNGYAAFKVANTVTTFQGWGMGSYIFTNVNPNIHVTSAFEAPVTPGVQFHHLLTINLSGPGTIDYVINTTGGSVSSSYMSKAQQVISFP